MFTKRIHVNKFVNNALKTIIFLYFPSFTSPPLPEDVFFLKAVLVSNLYRGPLVIVKAGNFQNSSNLFICEYDL